MKSGTRKEFVRREGRLEGEGTNEASARCGQLDVLNGEWEVVVIRIVDEETVIDVLLEAFGFVASGDQWAGLSGSISFTFFNASVLIVFDAVRFDFVDDDTPFAFGVDCTEWLNVRSGAGAEISFFLDFGQSVDRVGSFSHDILVQSHNGFVVFVEFVNNFIGRVLGILQTPVLGRVLGAGRDLGLVFGFVFWLVIRWRFVIVAHHSHNS